MEGLQNRSLVFETALRYYEMDAVIMVAKRVLWVDYPVALWGDTGPPLEHAFHESALPCRPGAIIACDTKILSEYRDIIYQDRRLLTPWGD